MDSENQGQTIIIWGSGGCFRENYSKLQELYNIRYICDNNSSLWGKEIVEGIKCISPDELLNIKKPFVIIAIYDVDEVYKIQRQLKAFGCKYIDIRFAMKEYYAYRGNKQYPDIKIKTDDSLFENADLEQKLNILYDMEKSIINSMFKLFNEQNKKIDHMERSIIENTQIDFWHLYNKNDKVTREIQKACVYLLEKLREICNENKITYWIQGGTLLGAYRNNGFIPWDDDIDVGMTREDFIRFKQIVSQLDEFEVVNCFHLDYLKCRMPKFKFKNSSINCFIDIFPYDIVRSLYSIDEIWFKRLSVKADMIYALDQVIPNLDRHYIREQACVKDEIVLNEIFDNFNRDFIKSVESGKNEGKYYVIFGIDNIYTDWKRVFDYDFMFPRCQVAFEGNYYFAPRFTKDYLELQYGDFLELPNDLGIREHMQMSRAEYSDLIKFNEENFNG